LKIERNFSFKILFTRRETYYWFGFFYILIEIIIFFFQEVSFAVLYLL